MRVGNRLALGTVQIGLPYGIANRSGQVSYDDAVTILKHARAAGLDTLDTAVGYGDSEERLGKIGVAKWRIVSKLPGVPESCTNVCDWVRVTVMASLRRLRVPKLRALLLHNAKDLAGPRQRELYGALGALKNEGLVEKIGLSIYGTDELDSLWGRYELDIVQAPFNIIDRRIVTSGWLDRMATAGTEVHVRSIFMQGLLLMPPAGRPNYFDRWQPLWGQWDTWLAEHELSPLQACLAFALSYPAIDRVVIGVDSPTQLDQVVAVAGAGGVTPVLPPKSLTGDDPDLINPSHWSRI